MVKTRLTLIFKFKQNLYIGYKDIGQVGYKLIRKPNLGLISQNKKTLKFKRP